jgi:D-proline reductase (dithiol) PrdB
VGLAQARIEAAGLTTICLSNVPAVTHAVGSPRLAGIEFPFGMQLGRPGDRETQLAVLRATLHAVETMQTPGEVIHLPFDWTLSDEETNAHPPVPPPIATFLKSHPLQVVRLMRRDIPKMKGGVNNEEQ